MKLRRARENQTWILDYLVAQTGKSHTFDYPDRAYPASIRRYAMIPKHMAKIGHAAEGRAAAEAALGHRETALHLYYRAAMAFRSAQHAIRRDNDPIKIALYERLLACYGQVIALAPHPIERVEVPWGGVSLPALFHRAPGPGRAPCVLFLPGMDMIKEFIPEPFANHFLQRGMHVLSLDGPGMGESNLRKIWVTDDNFERAVSAAVDYLLQRSDVDPDAVGLLGVSMGSFWGARAAAYERRLAACVLAESTFGDKADIFERASPQFKDQFMYMSGLEDEESFDAMAERMTTAGYGARIRCPTLVVAGEFDPLCSLEEARRFFDEIPAPKELWALEDEFHFWVNTPLAGLGGLSFLPWAADWLQDALRGALPPDHQRVVYVPQDAPCGPYDGSNHPTWY